MQKEKTLYHLHNCAPSSSFLTTPPVHTVLSYSQNICNSQTLYVVSHVIALVPPLSSQNAFLSCLVCVTPCPSQRFCAGITSSRKSFLYSLIKTHFTCYPIAPCVYFYENNCFLIAFLFQSLPSDYEFLEGQILCLLLWVLLIYYTFLAYNRP